MAVEYKLEKHNGAKYNFVLGSAGMPSVAVFKGADTGVVTGLLKGMWLGVSNALPNVFKSASITGKFGNIVAKGDLAEAESRLQVGDYNFITLGDGVVKAGLLYEGEVAKMGKTGFYLTDATVTNEMLLRLNLLKPKLNKVLRTVQIEGSLGGDGDNTTKPFGLYLRATGENISLISEELEGFDYSLIKTVLLLLIYSKRANIILLDAGGLADSRALDGIIDVLLSTTKNTCIHVCNVVDGLCVGGMVVYHTVEI